MPVHANTSAASATAALPLLIHCDATGGRRQGWLGRPLARGMHVNAVHDVRAVHDVGVITFHNSMPLAIQIMKSYDSGDLRAN